ncbi:MAG: class I SAM-dependent methyltransferase [Ferruginibacter sp.]
MSQDEAFELIRTESIYRNENISKWADLGCGAGLFSLALARMLQKESIVYGIDKNNSLKPQVTGNGIDIIPLSKDFVQDDLGLTELDGILMANAFHYVKDKSAFIQNMEKYLKPAAIYVIVEYDTDIPVARWVPYPVSFATLLTLFNSAGYTHVKKLGGRPSIYGRGNMYSAIISR